MPVYRCYGADKEDLTALVEEKARARPTTIFRLKRGSGGRRGRGRDSLRIVAFCREGHKNVFEVKRDEL